MISSFNDIYKLPLFFGMGSDQYWSAGVNMQAKITDQIRIGYAFDLYYGKSNNKNPYNWDKWLKYQNYDEQRFFDLLLNRGQETFSFTDANGNLNTQTKFGFGTFWPSNAMHDHIDFPDGEKMEIEKISKDTTISRWKTIAKEPEEPKESDYIDFEKYLADQQQYQKDLNKYQSDKLNYEISNEIKYKPTFHHLYVLYNEYNEISWNRLKWYLDSDQPAKGKLLKEFYLLQENNKK